MSQCKQIRDRLAESGPTALQTDVLAQQHLIECEGCFEFLESLNTIQQTLAAMPPLDASDAVVSQLLQRDELSQPVGSAPNSVPWYGRWSRSLMWGTGGLVSAGLLVVLVLSTGREVGVARVSGLEPATERQYSLKTEARLRSSLKEQPDADAISDDVLTKDGFEGLSSLGYVSGDGSPAAEVQGADGDGNPNVAGARDRDFKAMVGGVSNADPLIGQQMSQVNPNSIEEMELITKGAGAEFSRRSLPFLDGRQTTQGVSFRDASGYWSNSYLPGDPMMRLLHARLSGDTSGFDVQALHGAAHPAAQPFDAPRNAALALWLQADRSATEGPARTLLQVGIKGVEHLGGRRPAMNLAVVLCLDGAVADDVATGMRAVADALNASRRPGDRFRLIVAGAPGAVLVDADHFRHGQLRVALGRLFEQEASDAPEWDVQEALSHAIGIVAEDDDPSTALGTSAVLLVAADLLDADMGRLSSLAHRAAVAGIPVGALAVGSDADAQQLEQLTIAGQGRFGLLLRPADAEDLVERELAAVSRAVARAVRLNIRLAPGVKLIDVIGSDRLDEVAADRVRQSEQSLDLRLARNLGISADRGDDEDGIQIVIPNFYASDEHVILLDVVASGPGPLAEVTAKFKDLVFLKNGTARASLVLARGTEAAKHGERSVLKNYLSHLLSDALIASSDALRQHDRVTANRLLQQHQQLLVSVSGQVPGLNDDREIARDIAVLRNYIAALTNSGITAGQIGWLADSLQYAAGARLQTPQLAERDPS